MTTTTDILRTACTAQTVIPTPLGPLLLARTASGLAGAWFEASATIRRSSMRRMSPATRCSSARPISSTATSPDRAAVSTSPLDLHGTPFQRAVWKALLAIRAGSDAAMATSRARSASRPRCARSAPRSAATRSRSWCRATASSAATARSPATPAA